MENRSPSAHAETDKKEEGRSTGARHGTAKKEVDLSKK